MQKYLDEMTCVSFGSISGFEFEFLLWTLMSLIQNSLIYIWLEILVF